MKKVGIFFGPVGGSTERVAKQIQKEFGSENADLIPIISAKSSDIDKYENVIFGCSTIGGETWDTAKSKPDWDIFRPELEKIDYSNKTFALFGLGDHLSYPRNYVDTMGIIASSMILKKAKIIGRVSKEGYEFTDSEAVIDGQFIGLPIDEEFEPEMTELRVRSWVQSLKANFK